MHEKDKSTHQHHAPFTMETIREVLPGTKVYVEVSPSHKLHGELGHLLEGGAGDDPTIIIRFQHTGHVVKVTPDMVHHIHLEPLN